MLITRYEVGQTVEYIPDYCGNRDLPKEDQMIAVIKPFSNQDAQQYKKLLKVYPAKKKDDGIQTNSQEVQKIIAINHIVTIKNFSWQAADGTVVAFKDVADFYDTAPPELVEDILEAIQNRSHLDEGKKKA